MKYYIITGTSRGLGEAIAKQLLNPNHTLFCISRTKNEDLIRKAKENLCQVYYYERDLSDINDIEHLIEQIMDKITEETQESICLINNAGVVKPIKPIGECFSSDIITNININTIAPLILTNEFIKETRGFTCNKVVVNISSGAANKPYHGWASYCSSKAALDMFTQCVGVEQNKQQNPVKIFSFSPGIMETSMQQEIRQSKAEDFEQIARFKKFKEEGLLRDPKFIASKVIEQIENSEVKSGSIIDIKNLLD
jgi:benzil reductase ((S)-benzoin forming)